MTCGEDAHINLKPMPETINCALRVSLCTNARFIVMHLVNTIQMHYSLALDFFGFIHMRFLVSESEYL